MKMNRAHVLHTARNLKNTDFSRPLPHTLSPSANDVSLFSPTKCRHDDMTCILLISHPTRAAGL